MDDWLLTQVFRYGHKTFMYFDRKDGFGSSVGIEVEDDVLISLYDSMLDAVRERRSP